MKQQSKKDEIMEQEQDTEEGNEEENGIFIQGKKVKIEEDRVNEFKAVQNAADSIARITSLAPKYVNAFLNTDGGRIFMGIEDDGTVVGLRFDRKMKDILRLRLDASIDAFRPSVDPDLWAIKFIPVIPATSPPTTEDQRVEDVSKTKQGDATAVHFIETPNPPANELNSSKSIPIPIPTTQNQGQKSRSRSNSIASSPGASPGVFGTPITAEGPTSLYVIEVSVMRGRAPIYFTAVKSHGSKAYIRLNGSVHEMTEGMINERKSLGRITPQSATLQTRGKAFIGRVQELQQVRSFVENHLLQSGGESILEGDGISENEHVPVACVILKGSPLVGKSSLAKQLVTEMRSLFPDRQLSIELHSEEHPLSDAMMSIIRVLFPTVPYPRGDLELKGLYESCFSGKRCILLLEDVKTIEQAKVLIPTQARALLVIITTRFPIELDAIIDSALTLRLGPLKPDDAVSLLRTMAPYNSTSNNTAVILSVTKQKKQKQDDEKTEKRLCELCGFMPVAIRLVAGILNRQPNVEMKTVIKQLESDPKKLSDLVAPFIELGGCDWHGFAVSVFPDSFDGAAASKVFEIGYDETMFELSKLVDASILDFDPLTGRYFQSDIVRRYNLSQAEKKFPADLLKWKERFCFYILDLVNHIHWRIIQQQQQNSIPGDQSIANIPKIKVTNTTTKTSTTIGPEAIQLLIAEKKSIEFALEISAPNHELHQKIADSIRPLLSFIFGGLHVDQATLSYWEKITAPSPSLL